MKQASSWVLLAPVACFAVAAWLFVHGESDARVHFERAESQWRSGNYLKSIRMFKELQKEHPRSRYAVAALREIARIYYFNLYDISNALHYYEQLVETSPDSKWAAESHLRIAEIFELELNELPNAIEHWKLALKSDFEEKVRHRIRFKIADALFRTNKFDEALKGFQKTLSEGADPVLIQQAKTRIGTIYQVRREYQESIRILREVLDNPACPDCRLQAQLGLIESYEFQDRLSDAIAIARQINTSAYPPERQKELLNRLLEKRKYYEPDSWKGR